VEIEARLAETARRTDLTPDEKRLLTHVGAIPLAIARATLADALALWRHVEALIGAYPEIVPMIRAKPELARLLALGDGPETSDNAAPH
jgi:hypothetical protein